MYQHYVNVTLWGSVCDRGRVQPLHVYIYCMYISIFILVINDRGYLTATFCTQEVHYT